MNSAAASQSAMFDVAQIERCFVAMRRAHDQVNEIRILTDTRSGTVAGFFNDPKAMASAVAEWSGRAECVYWTLNPTKPEMLAKSNNALHERIQKGWSTNNEQISRRIWLPIADIDPERVKGISSTDQQHQTAIDVAREVYPWLMGLGVAKESMIVADSGNGCHVLLAIDLANDAESEKLVKLCIAACAVRFSRPGTIFDLGNYNSSRIWKVYGSKACKGADMPEHPHRIARILYAPAEVRVCLPDTLKKFASLAPSEPEPERHAKFYRAMGA